MQERNEEMDRAIYGSANIQQYKTDVAFKTFVEGIKDNLYVIPEFQRVYKWTEQQVEDLAVSLVKGMPIPPIYTYRNENNQLEILDGQQRALSMYFYYAGKYTKKKRNNYIDLKKITQSDTPFEEQLKATYDLKDKNYEMKYYDLEEENEVEKSVDITYSTLPSKVKRKVDYTSITVIEINIDDSRLKERYLYKIFANLNSGGTPLTDQELRNGIYRCPFYEMLFSINDKNHKFNELFGSNKNYSKNIEVLLRFSAFKYFVRVERDEFIIDSYTNMSKLLNDFSEDALRFDQKTINVYQNSIENFMEKLHGKIKVDISLLENLFVVSDKKKICLEITQEMCEKIKKNTEYSNTIKSGNSTKTMIETKLRTVYNEVRKFNK